MDHVGMFGEGSGATIAILAAAVEPRLKVLDLLDPWGDWPDWLSKSSLIPKEERADYLKPEFLKQVELLEPIKWLPQLQSRTLRLQDALYARWKLNWFLRDFGYDADLLGQDEIDDKNLVGLRGVVKVSHVVVNGTSRLNLDGFAPVAQWAQLSSASTATLASSEVAK
jgi:hypothetical protein